METASSDSLVISFFNRSNGYSAAEIEEARKFLGDFSYGGALYLARLMDRARLARKPFADVMRLLYEKRDGWWQCDDPGRRGDPDNPAGGRGMKNACTLCEIYKKLGLEPKIL